jgi:hypothetical protein
MAKPSKERPDGRRAVLLYLDPELITQLKIRALTERIPVYRIVEDILRTSKGLKVRK